MVDMVGMVGQLGVILMLMVVGGGVGWTKGGGRG